MNQDIIQRQKKVGNELLQKEQNETKSELQLPPISKGEQTPHPPTKSRLTSSGSSLPPIGKQK